jgi:hypothetical protein
VNSFGSVRRNVLISVTALVVIGGFVVIQFIMPPILLKKLNAELAEISPVYSLHIDKLRIHLFRMAYRFENIEGHLKKSKKLFTSIEVVDVSIAWSELIRGRILTDVDVNRGNVILSPELFAPPPEVVKEGAVEEAKEAAQTASRKLFPIRIASVRLRNCDIRFGDFLEQPDEPLWRIGEINGALANLNPSKSAPLTYFNIGGTMLGSAMLKAAGRAERQADPLAWDVDAEIKGFDLVRGNKLFVKYVPLSFSTGTLDMFAEVKSERGEIRGYVKPFLNKIHVIGDKRDFKGLKHFAIELVAGLGNLILRSPETHTLASRIAFVKPPGGKFSIDTEKALASAIDNGFGKPLPKSLEDSVGLTLKKGELP